jgi:hypothetical protein
MARTAADVLRIARSQIGYEEGRNNANKYGAAYGMNNVFWCQQFVWWVFHQAGVRGEMPKTAVTRVAYPWYRRHRRERDAIRWIQARLNHAAGGRHRVLDGRTLAVDGEFGALTEKVVEDFQRRKGLRGLGVVGPKTWPLLNAVR